MDGGAASKEGLMDCVDLNSGASSQYRCVEAILVC